MSEPVSERQQQLEDALRLQQFCRDVEDELQWIKEHKNLADSSDYGKSLLGVQNLQKKHQVGVVLFYIVFSTKLHGILKFAFCS